MSGQPPIPASVVSPEWIEAVREAAKAGQFTLRASEHSLGIEGRNHLQNRWHAVMLFGSGYEFTTAQDRDEILAKLTA